jgi:transcriptional regulator with XRE-family HTH domain
MVERGEGRSQVRTFDPKRLRAVRESAGVRRETLADKIQMSVWSVIGYELGRTVPTANTLAAIADSLEVDLGDFYACDARPAA